jgi:hypothetical protein
LLHQEKNYAGIGIYLQSGNSILSRTEFPNNPSYSCYLTSLSPAFRLERKVVSKKQKAIVFNLTNTVSIFGYIIRPSLGTVSPISYSDKLSQTNSDYFSSGRVVTLNKLQQLTSSFAIDFHLSKRAIFSIGYNWNYMHYGSDPQYYQVNHQIFTYVGIEF